jgi:hypothetical protein
MQQPELTGAVVAPVLAGGLAAQPRPSELCGDGARQGYAGEGRDEAVDALAPTGAATAVAPVLAGVVALLTQIRAGWDGGTCVTSLEVTAVTGPPSSEGCSSSPDPCRGPYSRQRTAARRCEERRDGAARRTAAGHRTALRDVRRLEPLPVLTGGQPLPPLSLSLTGG